MRAIDQIRGYIKTGLSENKLSGGSLLPSYHEFMRITGASYATVLNAMKSLQREGLVELRHGKGTFVAGGKTLQLCILYHPQTLPERTFRSLLEKYLLKTNLNLTLKFYPIARLKDPGEYQRFLREEQHAVIFHSLLDSPPLPFRNLSGMEGYDAMEISGEGDLFHLPFLCFSSQFAINCSLVRKTGFDPDRMDSSFDWWDSFAGACRKHGIPPAALHWNRQTLNSFLQCCGILLTLFGDVPGTPSSFGKFSSFAGERFLRILKDQHYYNIQNRNGSFFNNAACMSLAAGSWIATQNHSQERPDIQADDLKIIPMEKDGRKIKLLDQFYLSAYFGESATVEERNRVWTLMRHMMTRDFQLDFCNGSGMISLRPDIRNTDYVWNRNGAMNAFVPEDGDLVFQTHKLFHPARLAAMTLLLEDFLFHGASMKTTLERMDWKNTEEEIFYDPKTGVALQ